MMSLNKLPLKFFLKSIIVVDVVELFIIVKKKILQIFSTPSNVGKKFMTYGR